MSSQTKKINLKIWRLLVRSAAALGLIVLVVLASSNFASAAKNPDVRPLTPLTNPENPANSIGLEGKISAPPPTEAPTIATPKNGQNFANKPLVTVSGFCKGDLLVKVFNNKVFAGAVICNNGSYSLQVGLFSGDNELSAQMFDNLDQAGPMSNIVKVKFNNANFTKFGTLVTLTSSYARRGADPGKTLSWPLTLDGGSGPYALSIDWGDGQPVQLFSQPVAGNFNIEHVYSSAGAYKIVIKAADANGVPAFLQVVGVANGQLSDVKQDTGASTKTNVVVKVVWWPAVAMFVLCLVGFWLGRRYELLALRKRIEREAREFAAEDENQ